jgi:hypothetical protein
VRRSLAKGAGRANCETRTCARARTRARNAPRDRLDEGVRSAERTVARALAAQRHMLAVRATAARRWRSEPPNRGPPKANGEAVATVLRVLASGVDSLYVSFRGEVDGSRLDELEALKARAQEAGHPQVVDLGIERVALVQATGWGRYRYWLRCGDFDVFVGQGRSLPAVYARVASSFIHEIGPTRAVAELKSFVLLAFQSEIAEAHCSRVDIYADFQGWVPRPHDYERFVTRSRRNTSHVAIHHDGRHFTGFTFGRDAMVARLYDKGAEIAHSGKDWMRTIWGDRLDPLRPVWRLEFQLRREVLAQCSLQNPDVAVEKRQDLWTYATHWLSLRSPRPGVRRTRWPVAIAWVRLSNAALGASKNSLVRQRISKHDESVLVRGLAGYASSLAAVAGVSDLDVTMLLSRRRVAEYMDATGRDFREVVRAKRERQV